MEMVSGLVTVIVILVMFGLGFGLGYQKGMETMRRLDDSIIEDKEAESNRALREVQAGLMSKVEYRELIYGETPEIAEQAILKIEESNPSIEDLIGGDVIQEEEDRTRRIGRQEDLEALIENRRLEENEEDEDDDDY